MNTKKLTLIITLGIILVISSIWIGMSFSYNNKEVALRQEAAKQYQNIEAVRDNMWKILQDQTSVTSEYREAFNEIYTNIIAGRYEQGDGTLLKFIKESNPNFDATLYKDLMKSIEVERTAFTREQTKMLDIIREHETLLQTRPSKWFITNDSSIVYTVISSDNTKKVMETGVDNDQIKFHLIITK